MSNTKLTLVDISIPEGSPLDKLGQLEGKIEELINQNTALKEEIRDLCDAVGLGRMDYERFRAGKSILELRDSMNNRSRLNSIVDSLLRQVTDALDSEAD